MKTNEGGCPLLNRRGVVCRPGRRADVLRRLGHAALFGMSMALLIGPAPMAQEQPSPIAPYRYTSPPAGALDSLEQQKAFSYRNKLSAQQRLMELNRTPRAGAASQLRSQGELNREIDRMDHVLQR